MIIVTQANTDSAIFLVNDALLFPLKKIGVAHVG